MSDSHDHDHAGHDHAGHDHAGHDHSHHEDPEKVRLTAHVILDGVTAYDDAAAGTLADEEALELAFARLLEIEAIELSIDEDEEQIELDVAPLMSGVMAVVRHLVGELAARDQVSREEVVAAARAAIDAPSP